MAKIDPKRKPRKKPINATLKDMQDFNVMRKAYMRTVKQNKVGQGYAGLGPQELKRRKYQAKYLTKKAGAKADKLEYMANQLATTGYPDLFGDEKWLKKQAEGYRKTQAQFDKQYNKLGR